MKEMRPILEEISRKQTYFLVLVLSLFIFISCSDDSKVQDKKCPTNCETWEACNADFNCELKEGYCIDKDNCNDDEICNSEHKCEKATVNDCLINDDCGLNQICNNEKKCEYKEGYCLSDNDCKNSQVCNSENLCEDKVQVNNCFETNCQEWETCNQETKSCDFISGKCQSDEDCESELKCNNQNYCSFESETPEDNYISTTIQNLQTDTNFIDKKVQTTGIITAIALSQKRKPKGLYIQFGEVKHSGIYVYFIEASDTNLKVGDRVIFPKYKGSEIKLDGIDYIIIEETDLLAVMG